MASRKPLVIVNGEIQQISSSDTLDANIIEQEIAVLTNGETASMTKGQPVYISAANTAKLAKADATGTKECLALVSDASITASSTGAFNTDGILTATTEQWDAVTGGSGGLTPGAKYYLSAETAGMLTDTAPTGSGQYVVKVGNALSTTELKLQIQQSVLL